ncbi:hypothetical protein SteCoe_34354 [Stentor coeruleus]|uniref:Nucleoporin Nup54 alpha-helical domain-containing protein n=1 Tax=Stentor coeruleus TaxID=5963 RepID=A0A1R2AUQ7_9CILI|nr:hypothetical protein SteCoe_34354 [Stentor coeruleus]
MSLFGKPQGPAGGSLFNGGQAVPGQGLNSSMFSSVKGSTNPVQSFFSNGPGQGSLFGQNAPSGGGPGNASGNLFGGNLGAGTNTGSSLLGGNLGTGTNTGRSLFGGNPSTGINTGGNLIGGNQDTGTNAGGNLFGGSGNPGGSFGPQNTGNMFSNPQANLGGAFNQPTANTGGLFSQTPGGASLFGGNTGTGPTGLFGQSSSGNPTLNGNPSSGFFTQPIQNTGFFNNSSNPILWQNLPGPSNFNPYTQSTPNTQFIPSQDIFSKRINELSDNTKNNLFNLKGQIDSNEVSLNQSENILNNITKYKNELKQRIITLFTFSHRVQTGEKRCKVTIETLKRFQINIISFIKEAVKVFNHCDSADQYHQIESPAGFLSNMLIVCEDRLKCIEENFKEIQDIVSIENKPFELSMLVNTIAMMQEKFELVSSIAYDMHKRVQEVLVMYPRVCDNTGSLEKKEGKVEKGNEQKGYSSLRDIITGRLRDFDN